MWLNAIDVSWEWENVGWWGEAVVKGDDGEVWEESGEKSGCLRAVGGDIFGVVSGYRSTGRKIHQDIRWCSSVRQTLRWRQYF
jgi:hypothetical protein